jgi:D-alanyl-D-alanine carboxypeptidase
VVQIELVTGRELAELCASLGISASYGADRGLTPHCESPETKLIEIASASASRVVCLNKDAALAWHAMHTAAARQNINLLPLSGFRSIARQADILRAKLAAGQQLADILRVNAAPGYSEHHTGRALDIGTPGAPPFEESFAHTPAFAWLVLNAPSFGFVLSYPRDNPHGIAFEPWHWCWHPHA